MVNVKFIIITVNFNNSIGLDRTLKSIIRQDFKSFHVIVIDAKSKDLSGLVLSKYSNLNNFTVVSESDQGVYDGMNKGILLLNKFNFSSYVIFMNSGDLFSDSTILSKINEQINGKDYHFIYGDSIEVFSNQKRYKKSKPIQFLRVGLHTHHQSIFYKSDLLLNQRYDLNFSIGADYKLTAEFYLKNSYYYYFPFPICDFQVGGLNSVRYLQGALDQYHIRRSVFKINPFLNIIYFIRSIIAVNLKKILYRL